VVGVLVAPDAGDAPRLEPVLVDELVAVQPSKAAVLIVEQPQPLPTRGPGEQLAIQRLLVRIPTGPGLSPVVLEAVGPARELRADVVLRRDAEDLAPRLRPGGVEHHVDLLPFESLV